jgi:hypothetical protein
MLHLVFPSGESKGKPTSQETLWGKTVEMGASCGVLTIFSPSLAHQLWGGMTFDLALS